GDIPLAQLASAEQQIMTGRPREALQNAEAAARGLPHGSTDWIRAGDVALQARGQLERERERNSAGTDALVNDPDRRACGGFCGRCAMGRQWSRRPVDA